MDNNVPAMKSKVKQRYKSEYSMTDFIPKTIQIKENGLKEESILESVDTRDIHNQDDVNLEGHSAYGIAMKTGRRKESSVTIANSHHHQDTNNDNYEHKYEHDTNDDKTQDTLIKVP